MKNIIKFILIILCMFWGMNFVSAASRVKTCDYEGLTVSGKQNKVKIEINKNGKLTAFIKQYDGKVENGNGGKGNQENVKFINTELENTYDSEVCLKKVVIHKGILGYDVFGGNVNEDFGSISGFMLELVSENDIESNDNNSNANGSSNTQEPDYNVDNTTTIDSVCASPSYRKVMKVGGIILNFVRILVPIAIIVFGAIDLYKAITSSDDKRINKAAKSIIVRVIAGVFIFLLPGIIQFALNMVNEWSDYKNSWCCCTDCLLNPDCDVNSCNSDSCKIEGMN